MAQSSDRLQGHHPLLSQFKASGGPGPVARAPGACKGLSQHPSALPQFQVPVVDARPLTKFVKPEQDDRQGVLFSSY